MTRSTSIALKRNKLVIGGVATLAVIVALLSALVLGRAAVVADDEIPSPTPVVTPEPSAHESPSEEPGETPVPSQPQAPAPAPSQPVDPEPVAKPLDGVLAPGSVVRVTVESIKLRYTPSTAAVIAGTVERGELVEIAYTLVADGFGPVEADGFVWYPVSLLNMTEMPELGMQRGYTGEILWMSVGNGTEAWVERVAPRCVEGDPDLATLETMFDFERIACFGERQITVEGVFGCGGCGGVMLGTFEPRWLASPMQLGFLSVDPQERIGPFALQFAPGGVAIPEGASILRVTGHFNDARSSECVMIPENSTHETDPVVEDLFCRKAFVVDSYEVIGVDENFPFS